MRRHPAANPGLKSSSRLSPEVGDARVSPRFGLESRSSQPDLTARSLKKARQQKAEAAHVARRRNSGLGETPSSEGKAEQSQEDSMHCSSEVRRPNPLLSGRARSAQGLSLSPPQPHRTLSSTQVSDDFLDEKGRARIAQGLSVSPPKPYRTLSYSQTGEPAVHDDMTNIFEAVLQEHASYLAAFGETDSDDEICSFAGSDGDRVTALCQRAQSLILELGASVTPPITPTAKPPPEADQFVISTPLQAPSSAPHTFSLPGEEDEEEGPQPFFGRAEKYLLAEGGEGPCQGREISFGEQCVVPRPASPTSLPVQVTPRDEDPSTWPGSPALPGAANLYRALGASVTPQSSPRHDVSRRAPDSPEAQQTSAPCEDEDPSLWPDLQPWLRGMCPSVSFDTDASVTTDDKGAVRLSDLQFRISRVELQVCQITSAEEKPSEVSELRKEVQRAQAELQATRLEAQETNAQLRLLMQHVGKLESSPFRHESRPVTPVAVFRSSSVSSQESHVQLLHRAPSAQSSVAERSPVPLPRARSLESVARRQLYPSGPAGPAQHSRHSLHAVEEKLTPKRRSIPSGARVADVPVRMCTSEQLLQVAKQRPLWLQKAADSPCSSNSGGYFSARMHPCTTRRQKAGGHA